jgi:hypothetical protein
VATSSLLIVSGLRLKRIVNDLWGFIGANRQAAASCSHLWKRIDQVIMV